MLFDSIDLLALFGVYAGIIPGQIGVEELMICVMFHWCSQKNGLKNTCFLGMARERILGVISTMSVVHLFQDEFLLSAHQTQR